MKEAKYYSKLTDGKVQCSLCPHCCLIPEDRTGICRVRKNRGGTLYLANYARCTAYALDPIEKKPLYNYYPGSTILSVGTFGCNFSCNYCQNWEISQADAPTIEMAPEQVVKMAQTAGSDCIGIAYTYSEPLMWFEYVLDTARLAQAKGQKNVLVSNGYILLQPLAELLPYIDAINIDIKAFRSEFYRQFCGGRLEPVKKVIIACLEAGCHVELTTLLLPGCNDSPEEINDLVAWIASIDPNIPLHFSRYFPRYQSSLPPTSAKILYQAWEIARQRLPYVYLGNISGGPGSNTYCPFCGQIVVARNGVQVKINGLVGENCRQCGTQINITQRGGN